jgi:hypothetical protein
LALTYLLESERLFAAPAISRPPRLRIFRQSEERHFLFMEAGQVISTRSILPKLREMAGQKLPTVSAKSDHRDGRGFARWPIDANGSSMGKAASGCPTGCRTWPAARMTWLSSARAGAMD